MSMILIQKKGRANTTNPTVHVGKNFIYLNRVLLDRMNVSDGSPVSFYRDEDDPHTILMVLNDPTRFSYKLRQGRVGTPLLCAEIVKALGEYPRIEFTENEGEVLLHGQNE